MGRFFICVEERDGLLIAGEGNRIARPFWRDLPPFSGPEEVRVKAVVWPCAAEGEA